MRSKIITLSLAIFSYLTIITASYAEIHNLRIKSESGAVTVFHVELAQTPQERAIGLMRRDSLAADRGMLFIWPNIGVRQFWMKNTKISLDILFFDEDGILVHLEEAATPGSEALISSLMPVKYVLEINAGMAQKHKLHIGDYLLSPPPWSP